LLHEDETVACCVGEGVFIARRVDGAGVVNTVNGNVGGKVEGTPTGNVGGKVEGTPASNVGGKVEGTMNVGDEEGPKVAADGSKNVGAGVELIGVACIVVKIVGKELVGSMYVGEMVGTLVGKDTVPI
jgi:hypothetical protein